MRCQSSSSCWRMCAARSAEPSRTLSTSRSGQEEELADLKKISHKSTKRPVGVGVGSSWEIVLGFAVLHFTSLCLLSNNSPPPITLQKGERKKRGRDKQKRPNHVRDDAANGDCRRDDCSVKICQRRLLQAVCPSLQTRASYGVGYATSL